MALANAVAIVPDRLYWVPLSRRPRGDTSDCHFFTIDQHFTYWNFFLDFGPLNLGQLYRFCQILQVKLQDRKLTGKRIYLYCGTQSSRRANSACLIAAYSMLYLGRSPEEAWEPFQDQYPPFPPFHDASPLVCTYKLTILDCLRGIHKAWDCNFFNFDDFDIDEWEHYEKVEYGDLNWIIPGRFAAFAGPHEVRSSTPEGYYQLCPDDYIPYFKSRRVSLIVRLNKKYYDERRFTREGMNHIHLYYLDGSNAPQSVLRQFLRTVEAAEGAIAVHCKAGLGRTGTVIGCYLMKHFRFTAAEAIGWMRICRPGSVIGPQQHYLEELQPGMWAAGEEFRRKHGQPHPGTRALRLPRELREQADRPAREEVAASAAAAARGAGRGEAARSTPVRAGLRGRAAAGAAAGGGGGGVHRSPAGTPGGRSVASDASQGDYMRLAKAKSPVGASPAAYHFTGGRR